MRRYDTTFIIEGNLAADQRETLIGQFQETLGKLGGTVERVVRWGNRTLAYEIKKQLRGYYVIFYYTAEPTVVRPFEHELGLNEHVLRFMTMHFDGNHPSFVPDESETDENAATAASEPTPQDVSGPADEEEAVDADDAESTDDADDVVKDVDEDAEKDEAGAEENSGDESSEVEPDEKETE